MPVPVVLGRPLDFLVPRIDLGIVIGTVKSGWGKVAASRPALTGNMEIPMPQAESQSITLDTTERASPKNADAAGAFKISSDMEGPLHKIDQTKSALRLIAGDGALEECVQDALHLLCDVLGNAYREAEEMRGQICHKTWAYRYMPGEVRHGR